MLTKQKDGRYQAEIVSVDDLVPKDHLVRKIEAAIDFSFIYEEVEDMYCLDNGRPSIDPIVLIKIVFIQYLFGIRSMRQTIKEIETNVAYRWFLGYGLYDKIPHFSTFGKNYERRFKDTQIFENIFMRILELAINKGFVDAEEIFVDSTHMKANANKRKYKKVLIEKQARHYQKQLEEEINKDRQAHGKPPLKKQTKKKLKEVKISKTDPEAGLFYKNEKEKCFAYSLHTACDKRGFIVSHKVTPGNVHDSQVFESILKEAKKVVGTPSAVAADAGYKTPHICKTLIDEKIKPVLPYKRPQTPKGYLKKHEYVYDQHYDCYICPQNKILKYSTTNRDGYRVYRSNPEECKHCPLLKKCTKSKDHTKIITRHIWQDYIEEAEHLRHTKYNKKIYAKRKETIERVFADLKEKHGLRWTTLRGLKKVSMQVTLAFTCMNLKKIANWVWKNNKPHKYFSVLIVKIHNLIKKPRELLKYHGVCLQSETRYGSNGFLSIQTNLLKLLLLLQVFHL